MWAAVTERLDMPPVHLEARAMNVRATVIEKLGRPPIQWEAGAKKVRQR